MSRYIVSPEALQDLREISQYFYRNKSSAKGKRLIKAFNQKCQQLINFHELGRKYDHLQPRLRGVPVSGYILLYRIGADEGLEIVRFVNGRRNLEDLFSENNE